ncbi:SDR family oxidoreductase [Streptomyces sp. NPDC057950]|uniref:SDR family oxidoreductase n=1 Tax=Streptomyces sp. NPDC057950 TaxID=3346288 RepID=UPI0036EC6B6B
MTTDTDRFEGLRAFVSGGGIGRATPVTLAQRGASPEVMAARIARHPIGRIAQPQEIADTIVWLCSGRSTFVTGAIVPVDGGYTVR